MNNLAEQNYGAIKQRCYPMLGFENFESAAPFCSAFDEPRQYLRIRRRRGKHIPPGEQRGLFVECRRSPIVDMTMA